VHGKSFQHAEAKPINIASIFCLITIMPLQIYNSLTRKKEEFIALQPPQVKMYVCGPTVYDEPHLGHARSAYIFDVIRRYLIYRGYQVKFVRNVTDVDDKIIEKARQEYPAEDLNSAFKKVADKYLLAYHEALNNLGIASASPEVLEPRASEYIAKMAVFIGGLIAQGVAYERGGDVYFDISRAKNYGKLSNQSLEKMTSGARVEPSENKRSPLDFALWKSAKENEPSWDSPWGRGRPGWHIECSVMSSELLGDEFDIHAGGLDLIFPHHENEIAQSEGAGKKFARCWLHHGLLTINGQKMSKSLGNFVTVKDFMAEYSDSNLLKLFFLSAHYSHPLDYTAEKIEETKPALERIVILSIKVTGASAHLVVSKDLSEITALKNKFVRAMDDDFNMPQALAVIFELVNLANKNIADVAFIRRVNDVLSELLPIFGISLKPEDKVSGIPAGLIEAKIQQRQQARQQKDFRLSDEIRRQLEEKGIILEDTKDGKTTWRRKL
jgi:cysteinyl-tRNA synthetase